MQSFFKRSCGLKHHLLNFGSRLRSHNRVSAKHQQAESNYNRFLCNWLAAGGALHAKGAITIRHRRSPYTYGMECRQPWVEGVSPPGTKVTSYKGEAKCRVGFKQYVSYDEALPVGHTVHHTFQPTSPDQDSVDFCIYATTDRKASFTSQPGMHKVGQVSVRGLQAVGLGKKYTPEQYNMRAKMKFGGVIITVTVTDLQTGKELSTEFSFPSEAGQSSRQNFRLVSKACS
jgi:hypothetical protein